MEWVRNFLRYRAANTFLVFIGLVMLFSLLTPNYLFVDRRNLAALGKLFPDLGVVALGVGVLMICGEFDLSVSSVLPFCSYVFVRLLYRGIAPFWAFWAALGVGALLGLLNGLITVKTKMPSFITTLGTMMFWRGVLYIWSKMMPAGIRNLVPSGSPFERTFAGTVGSFFPVQALWFTIFAVFLGILLHYHRFGNWIYATGDNRDAARAMGINTDLVKTICFMIVGVLCGFSACMQAVRIGSFAATQGIGFELRAIAACVVGGTSLRGGVGSMPGIVLGALTIPILDNGLILLRVPVFGISAFIGIATILFVVLNSYVERKTR
ncbi:ABC transporter permease [Candidatus Caldatribacterium sp. SIUC1]|uniref:ABC transporter permease n=1 Tax=Candidatus Caldatribacterium sp. SIUC1 TaxID=3418365 RepID=UPI003F69402F